MDNIHGGFDVFTSTPGSLHPLLAGDQIRHHPLYFEQPQDLPAYSCFFPLPSPTTAEQFPVSMGTFQFEAPHAPTTTATVDPSIPGLGRLESRRGRMSSTMIQGDHASVPLGQPKDPVYLAQDDLPCGRSRECESLYAPPPPSFPSVFQPLSSVQTHPYSGMEQPYDAYTSHVLGGANSEAYTSFPDGDNSHSTSFEAYDFPVGASAADSYLRMPIRLVTHNAMLSAHSATTLPSSLSTPAHDSADRYASRRFECQWTTSDGVHCQFSVVANRRNVIHHLHHAHGIKPGDEKARQQCQWERCGTVLNKESLARHILTVHLKEKVKCTECGEFFAREDSLKRHLDSKGGHHHVPPCKPREGATAATATQIPS